MCESLCMDRTVDLDLLEKWLARNGGVVELSLRSKVSPHTIMKMKNRMRPRAPTKNVTKMLLAEAIGVSIDQLFPLIGADGNEAS